MFLRCYLKCLIVNCFFCDSCVKSIDSLITLVHKLLKNILCLISVQFTEFLRTVVGAQYLNVDYKMIMKEKRVNCLHKKVANICSNKHFQVEIERFFCSFRLSNTNPIRRIQLEFHAIRMVQFLPNTCPEPQLSCRKKDRR